MIKKILLGISFVVLLVGIPLTIYLLGQKQEVRTRATPSTSLSLSLSSPSQSIKTGDTFGVDVSINPGINQVSFVKLSIDYESSKISTSGAGFEVNTQAFPVTLEGPVYTDSNILVTVSVGADPTKVIQSPTKIGKITFKAVAPTGATPIQVAGFNSATQVLSIASSDTPSENVLSTTIPLSLAIGGDAASAPPNLPLCSALNADRDSAGNAPFFIAFTANGTDTDGTISKVAFDFGDGPVQEVTQGGGIGTKTVSVQASHTYENSGTFTARATLTDNQGNTSSSSSCSKTVTVSKASGSQETPGMGGQTGSQTPAASPTATLTPPQPSPTSTLQPFPTTSLGTKPEEAPGSQETMLLVGGIGVLFSVLGGLLLLGL